jgi:hypothetical protein
MLIVKSNKVLQPFNLVIMPLCAMLHLDCKAAHCFLPYGRSPSQKGRDASMARGGATLGTFAYSPRSYLGPTNRSALPSLALLPAIDLL